VVQRSTTGEWILVDTTVSVAEDLLSASYHDYRHVDTGVVVTRLAPGHAYSLPVAAAQSVDFIAPTLRFTRIQKRTLPDDVLSAFSKVVENHHHLLGNGSFFNVPSFLRALYQLPDAYGKASNNLQCVCRWVLASALSAMLNVLTRV